MFYVVLFGDDGRYAPFCKHLFVQNFTDTIGSILEITPENESLLKSGYQKRTEHELAVLSRWFPKQAVCHLLKRAQYLDVILYSREQMIEEYGALKQEIPSGMVS